MQRIFSMQRELLATALFAAAGIVGVALSRGELSAVLANGLFYAGLIVNTYFSIRFFGSQQPQDRDERLIDGALVVAYVALALSIGWVIVFTFVSVILFAGAVAKYILLLPVLERRDLVWRKIAIDGLGLAFVIACFIGAWAGYPLASVWAQAVIFNVANAYLLLVRPMYAE